MCGRNGHVECIQPLIFGGAHIDFRGGAGLTPIHRAAIGGNAQAMKVRINVLIIMIFMMITVSLIFGCLS